MVGSWPVSPALAPLSGNTGISTYPISLSVLILHIYPNYPIYLSELYYILISIILNILSYIPIILYMPM